MVMTRSSTPEPADMTRSWSTRIASTSDPYLERPAPRNKPVVGFSVEERRTDGDRSTRLVNTKEWLERPDHNALRPAPRAGGPGSVLPRHSARDHLSESSRRSAMYDPARRELPGRVRVTQRSSFDDCSSAGRRRGIATDRAEQRQREWQLAAAAEAEALAAAEANELLELRSLGIRAVLAKSEEVGFVASPPVTRSKTARAAAAPAPPPPPPPPPSAPADTWGSGGVAPSASAGWELARATYKPTKVDGQPMNLDVSWIVAPLSRDGGGFRPKNHPSGGDWKVAKGMEKRDRSPPPQAVAEAVGPVAFSMPASAAKVAAMRATPVRASG
jgi:hypothetical protein